MSYLQKRESNSYHHLFGSRKGDTLTLAHGMAIGKGTILPKEIFKGDNVCGYTDDLLNGNLDGHKTHIKHLFLTNHINNLCRDHGYDKSYDAPDALRVIKNKLDFWQIKTKANHCKSDDKSIFDNLRNFEHWIKEKSKNRYVVSAHVAFWWENSVDEIYAKLKNPAAVPEDFKKYIMTGRELCDFLGKDFDAINERTYQLEKNRAMLKREFIKCVNSSS